MIDLGRTTLERLPVRQYLVIAAIRREVGLKPGRRIVAPREKWLEWAENCVVTLESEGGVEAHALEMWEIWVAEVKDALWGTCFFKDRSGRCYGKGSLSLESAKQKYAYLCSNLEYSKEAYIDAMTNGYGWQIGEFRLRNGQGYLVDTADIIYPYEVWEEVQKYVVKE